MVQQRVEQQLWPPGRTMSRTAAPRPVPGEASRDDDAEGRRLLHAARAGDAAALERLLANQEPALVAWCRGVLGHADDADDAAQETFLRALRALPTFRGEAGLRTWLFRIALNVCLEWKRSRARRPERLADDSYAPENARAASVTPSSETTALANLHLIDALACLAPRQRVILLLKEWEGWTAREIGHALRLSPRRVYHELDAAHRALADWRERTGLTPPPDAEKGQPK